MPAVQSHHARALRRDDEQRKAIFRRMVAWNSVCGGLALFIYLAEKLAA